MLTILVTAIQPGQLAFRGMPSQLQQGNSSQQWQNVSGLPGQFGTSNVGRAAQHIVALVTGFTRRAFDFQTVFAVLVMGQNKHAMKSVT